MKSKKINYNPKLDAAAGAIATDNRELVRECLSTGLEDTTDCAVVWVLQAWSCDSLQGMETALRQAIEIDPGNSAALAGLSWIHGIQEIADIQLEAKQSAEEAARIQREQERKRAEAEARAEAAEQARLEAEQQARLEAEQQARLEAEQQARLEAEQQARLEAEQQARLEAEQQARLEAEEQARLEAEQQARLEAEEAERIKREAARVWAEKVRAEDRARKQAEQEARIQQATERAEQHARRAAEEELRINGEEEQACQSTVVELPAEIQQQAEANAQANTDTEIDCDGSLELHSGVSFESRVESQTSESSIDPIAVELKDSFETLANEVRQEVELSGSDIEVIEPTAESDDAKPVILAVDDSPTIRKLVSLALTQQGFTVITAEDGVEALNVIRDCLPDLILSDINMPKLGGYQLCKYVKKHDRTKDIPVIMLSGKDGVFDKMRGKLNGCNAFLAKPFESKDLIEIVCKYLNVTTS